MNEKNNFSVIFFLGPPGSGKGTQIRLLAEKFGFYHSISSKLGMEYIRTHNDPETLKQKERYDSGVLFDPEWMLNVVKEKTNEIFNDSDGCKGIIYDGSPRTLFEAEKLYDFLEDKVGKENIKVIEINVDTDKLIERIKKRLICDKNSEHVYIRSEGLQPNSPCPDGDGFLKERDIDNAEIFKVRIDTYKKETMPALEFLKKEHNIIVIDGDQSIENVHKDVLKELNL